MTHRLGVVTLASLFALSLGVGGAIAAGGSGGPPDSRDPNPVKKESGEPQSKTGQKSKKERKSEQDFRDGYMLAFQLVQAEQYDAAFAAFKQLDADDHPDVANYLGYTARKLGDYALSRVWYERALASDPRHVRTWQYYGMWHVEQGNKLKAADFLEQIRLICGTQCKEYQDLKGGMEGTVSY
jgi:tetratricopeptide (TPR) repeat protein